jgi:hypothetical protein
MTTKLDQPLKCELSVDGHPYTLTITPDALHLVPKGRRKGQELRWVDLVSGDAALATALNASLARAPGPEPERRNGRKSAAPKSTGRTRTSLKKKR